MDVPNSADRCKFATEGNQSSGLLIGGTQPDKCWAGRPRAISIAGSGGGIQMVYKPDRVLPGTETVIDKDRVPGC
jgi:hypothetical protein